MIEGVEHFFSREQWQDPSRPVTGPDYVDSQVRFGVAHYTAAPNVPDGDVGESTNIPQYLQRLQRAYLLSRGYSLGYSFAIDWRGYVWEIRGFDYRPASNNGDNGVWGPINVNKISMSILFLVDGQSGLNDAMRRSARLVYRQANVRTVMAGGKWDHTHPKPHSETDATACPGDGIRLEIFAGNLTWDRFDDLGEKEKDSMEGYAFWRHKDHPELFLVGGGGVIHVDAQLRDHFKEQGAHWPPIVSDHDGVYSSFVQVSGT